MIVNTYGVNDAERVEKVKKAKQLFKKELGFESVNVLHNATKQQIIENLDILKSVAEQFEKEKAQNFALFKQ